MPITMVTTMPRGLGPGVMKRASRPTIRPMTRIPMIDAMTFSSDLECRQHRHVVRCFFPVAQVGVYALALEDARQSRRGEDVVEPPTAIGGAPVIVSVATHPIDLLIRMHVTSCDVVPV